jgi:multiple sugar transport system substrate-binding protein
MLMKRIFFALCIALMIGLFGFSQPTITAMSPTTTPKEKVKIRWYVGLSTGSQAEQLAVERQVVREFNNSQNEIELVLYPVGGGFAVDELKNLFSAGKAPDIIGPAGFLGANYFASKWLNLYPFISAFHYNLGQFPKSVVKLYEENGQLLGIPYSIYPGVIFYNKDLFDKAGLKYPPSKFGEKYRLEGRSLDWNWDTVAEISKRLTLDVNGKNAKSTLFDYRNITQWGFVHQWTSMRSLFSTFGGYSVVNTNGKVVLPAAWRDAASWYWNAVWKEHFSPTQAQQDQLEPNAFASGKVAMARVMSWYTCCLGDMNAKWDFAVMPSYKGATYAPANADTFRIAKTTKHPNEAFKVLMYLLNAKALITTYGAFPARSDWQDEVIQTLASKYPSVTHWDILPTSLRYAVVPSHESNYPNFIKGQDRFQQFLDLILSNNGANMNLNQELDQLQNDLQVIVTSPN